MTLSHLLLVALGGAGGATARYVVGVLALRWSSTGLPIGTWVANVTGCFLIGLMLPFVSGRETWRLLGVVGFLGGFTTFSSFSAETLALVEAGRSGWALLNVFVSVAAGLGAVLAGLALGRTIA